MSRPVFMALFVSLLLLMGGMLLLAACGGPVNPTARVDLAPAKAPGSNSSYASVDTEGKLVFYVKNWGDEVAPVTTTTVEVLDTGDTYDLSTPEVPAGTTVATEDHLAKPDCGPGDCHLRITVDSGTAITEVYENNNTVTWTLVG